MVTLKDVANRAGVSTSLVSYVLNGKKTVRPETHARIIKAVKELDYRPNLLARCLKTRESRTIGILVPDLSNVFYIEMIKGVEEIVNAAGYSTILCNSNGNYTRELQYISVLRSKNIDGLIYIGTGCDIDPELQKCDIPVVIIDRVTGNEAYTVTTDNVTGGYLATEYLLRKGRRHIAFIGMNREANTIRDRYTGYRRALAEFNVELDEKLYDEANVSYEAGYVAMCNMLEAAPYVDAVFASSDFLAFGAIRAVVDSKLTVPGDIAVIGYDDVAQSKYFIPALTTIHQPTAEMGQHAAQILVTLMRNGEVQENRIILQPELMIRETA